MGRVSRRRFCAAGAGVAAASLLGRGSLAGEPAAVTLRIGREMGQVPADFMGLSYESGQLVNPGFFSGDNRALVGLFRTLSPGGVLRLGGNLSEFTVWAGDDVAGDGTARTADPAGADTLVGPDPGHREPRTFTITPTAIRNLRAFLDATGWRCVYGLNLGGGTVEQALGEGGFVAQTLGPKLVCVQFGNEPDLFKHREQGGVGWTYEEFLAKWKVFRAAFREKLPSVPVAGPDTAYKQDWFGRFVNDVGKDIMLSTSHYYTGGPPSNPEMTTEFILHPGKRFEDSCVKAINSAKAAGLPFRMAEGNTCYNAGKPGVSDTFASALWAGDFCLSLATLGCVGVNLHGGAHGYYSPIVGSITEGFTARPEYYGLRLAQHFSALSLRETTLDAGGRNITAYAGARPGSPGLAVIFNKDADAAVVDVAHENGTGRVHRLVAPALDSKSGVTLAGAEVGPTGEFSPQGGQAVAARGGKVRVSLPGYSAALIQFE